MMDGFLGKSFLGNLRLRKSYEQRVDLRKQVGTDITSAFSGKWQKIANRIYEIMQIVEEGDMGRSIRRDRRCRISR